jgi:uncharacterized protein YecE (DUF72 family)
MRQVSLFSLDTAKNRQPRRLGSVATIAYASRWFSAIEINGSFYSLQRARWSAL